MKTDKLDIFSFDGFNSRFEYYLPLSETYQQAYEKAEEEVVREFNRRKYTDYESFKSSRAACLRRRRQNPGQYRGKWAA
jgi:hypothetical protein